MRSGQHIAVAGFLALGLVSPPCWLATAQAATANTVAAALVTRVSGEAQVHVPGGAGPMGAVDFVQAVAGERYTLAAGATVQLVYFMNGRRERWTGPAGFAIGGSGSTTLSGAAAKISFLPAGAVAALRKVGLRKKVSRRTAVGGVRVRGLKKTGQAAGGNPVYDSTFDATAAKKALIGALAIGPSKGDLKEPLLPGSSKTRKTGQKRMLAALPGPTAHSAARGAPAAQKQARHDRFVALGSGGAGAAAVSLRIVRLSAKGGSAVVARVGEQLAFEVGNLTAEPLHYCVMELGPGAADGMVLPAPGVAAILAPFERRRLPGAFAAAPPLGNYVYRIVATQSAERWWESPVARSPAKGHVLANISEVLRVLWHGPRPGAAHKWRSAERWGTAAVGLKIVAAPANAK